MARKKRLNKKFIIILALLLAIPASGLFVWKVVAHYFPKVGYIWRGTPESIAAEAKALFDQGNYSDACEKYKRAVKVRGSPTAELLTDIGDCYSHMVLSDRMRGNENLRLSRLFWDQALSIDPSYTPANRRLLDFFMENAEMSRGIGAAPLWQEVYDLAGKILAQDPKDRETELIQQRAVLMRWVSGAESDELRIQKATDRLTEMSQQPPFNAGVFFALVQARMYKAEERRRVNDRAGALAI